MSRILVVEDDADIRDLVELALVKRGYDVRSVGNGRQALDALTSWNPALIVLDLRMPVLDGRSFAQAYRALPGPHARLIVMTATRGTDASVAELGADAFLSKPFELEALMAEVARVAEMTPP